MSSPSGIYFRGDWCTIAWGFVDLVRWHKSSSNDRLTRHVFEQPVKCTACRPTSPKQRCWGCSVWSTCIHLKIQCIMSCFYILFKHSGSEEVAWDFRLSSFLQLVVSRVHIATYVTHFVPRTNSLKIKLYTKRFTHMAYVTAFVAPTEWGHTKVQ